MDRETWYAYVIVLFVRPFGFASRLERPKAKTLNPLSKFKVLSNRMWSQVGLMLKDFGVILGKEITI